MLYLKKVILIMSFLFLGGCMNKEKTNIPQEGDIVIWKQNNHLVVKAKLGERRIHIPDQFDSEFYRPEKEHYLGQFPISYIPEKFASITQKEIDSLPMPDSNRQLQFNLVLRNSSFQATDGYIPDHKDQVRVKIEGLTIDMREQKLDTHKIMLNNFNSKYIDLKSKFKKNGLDCYKRNISDKAFFCYGYSKNKDVTGVFLDVFVSENTSDNHFIQIYGNSYEPNKYGGIWVQWETNLNNWEDWQEIDNAIWRLLDIWNVAPLEIKTK